MKIIITVKLKVMKIKIIDSLQKIIGRERIEKLANNWAYKTSADAIAMNLFSLIYVLNDKFMGNKDWGEAWATRLTAAIGNTITGRPYGLFRDYMHKKFNIDDKSYWLKKYLVETLTFALGQSPLYAVYLAGGDMAPDILNGIKNMDLHQIINSYQNINPEGVYSAATSLTLVAPVFGTPQGWTYDVVRDQFGVND